MKKHIRIIATVCLISATPACSNGSFDSINGVLGSDASRILQTATGVNANRGLSGDVSLSSLASSDVAAALKQALSIGSGNVVSQLGAQNGFWGDAAIQIPLPDTLNRVDTALSAIGAGALTNDLKLRMNRAAERAMPKARQLFLTAISEMTFNDAKNILTGPDDAATTYLRKAMGPQLLAEMQPIISSTMAEAGVVQSYDAVMGQYQQIPSVSSFKTNLESYVGNKALDGVFYYVAAEEKAIRENPAKRTTDLLKTVFSAVK